MQLFFSFLLVGLFSVGGGYAAIPLIQAQVVEAHGWLSMAEFTNLEMCIRDRRRGVRCEQKF